MAIFGPITSFVIGGILVWIATTGIDIPISTPTDVSEVVRQMGPLPTLLLWVGSTNLSLGIFNLIPGFPLDGGRVLRSILWAVTNNLRRATRWASWVGQAIAWLMIIAGISMVFGARIPFFGTGFTSGLWLAFIGWFLNNASVQSYHRVVIQDILEGVPVKSMMRLDPPTCSTDCSVSRLVDEHIMGTDDQSFPVLDGTRLMGIVTLEDVRNIPRDAWETTNVAQIMTPTNQLVVVTADEDADKALSKLTQRDVRQLPVVNNGELLGLLRRRDIIKWLQLHSDLV
jgi:CBS domain-containing protein